MTVLTKSAMAERLYEELGLNKREAKEVVESLFEVLRSRLAANEPVKLSGFGNFDLRDKNGRLGRNPKTGEAIPIMARRVVTFRPGQKLRTRVEAQKSVRASRGNSARASRREEPLAFGTSYAASLGGGQRKRSFWTSV